MTVKVEGDELVANDGTADIRGPGLVGLTLELEGKVDGVPVFDCHYGTSSGRNAIKIDKLLTGADAGWLGADHE